MQLPQVSGHFSLDCWVCGLAPLSNLLVVLALPKARDEDGRRQRPQLMVFDPEQQVPFAGYELLIISVLSSIWSQLTSCLCGGMRSMVRRSTALSTSSKTSTTSS